MNCPSGYAWFRSSVTGSLGATTLALTLSLCSSHTARAGLFGGALTISTTPELPTVEDDVTLRAIVQFGDTGQERLAQFATIEENLITVDVYMMDLHTNPGWFFAQVITPDGAYINLGALDPGVYQVNATMHMTAWPYPHDFIVDEYFYPFAFADGVIEVSGVQPSSGPRGDFNGDGVVDILDLDILSTNFGQMGGAATPDDGDANDDGKVDILDLDLLSSNFGATTSASASVPEPAAFALLMMATLATPVTGWLSRSAQR